MKISTYCAIAAIAATLSLAIPTGAYADFICRITDANAKGGSVTQTGPGLPATGNRGDMFCVSDFSDLEDALSIIPRRPPVSGCLANDLCSARCPQNC